MPISFTPTNFVNRQVEKPNTYNTIVNADGTTTLIRSEGAITQEGTPLNATEMNKISSALGEVVTKSNQFETQLATTLSNSDIGQPNKVAPLDAGSKVPRANLPQELYITPSMTEYFDDFSSSASPFSSNAIAGGTNATVERSAAENILYDLNASTNRYASSATNANSGFVRHLNVGTLIHLPLYRGCSLIACFKQELPTNVRTQIGWAGNNIATAGDETIYTKGVFLQITDSVGALYVRNGSTTLRVSSTYTFNTSTFYRIKLVIDDGWNAVLSIYDATNPTTVIATLTANIQEIGTDSAWNSTKSLFNVMFKSVYTTTPSAASNLISWDYIGVRTKRATFPYFD